MYIKQVLDILDSIPLSIQQLENISGCSVILYEQLRRFRSLDDVFTQLGNKVVLLVRQTPQSGHFVLLMRLPKSIIYYDPYGWTLNELLTKTPISMQYGNLLEKLDKQHLIQYNRFKHQKDDLPKNPMATCGLHCSFRSRFNLSNPDYDKLMQSVRTQLKMDLDWFVVNTHLIQLIDNKVISQNTV